MISSSTSSKVSMKPAQICASVCLCCSKWSTYSCVHLCMLISGWFRAWAGVDPGCKRGGLTPDASAKPCWKSRKWRLAHKPFLLWAAAVRPPSFPPPQRARRISDRIGSSALHRSSVSMSIVQFISHRLIMQTNVHLGVNLSWQYNSWLKKDKKKYSFMRYSFNQRMI